MTKFAALFDLHYGYERKGGHKVPLHDIKALNATLEFLEDFKPHNVILGGDMLDCGAISHHNRQKPGNVEGLRILSDAKELQDELIRPIEELASGKLTYHIGNHEDWLQDLADELPGLEGLLDIRKLLSMGSRWSVIPQGEASNLGKLTFIHGDQLSSADACAKAAVIDYERNIRFGHFHTFQTYTKKSALGFKMGKTGMAVPCLCGRTPQYGEGKANKWMQGFLWGYVDGQSFNDYVSVIVDGKFMANGKEYKG